MLQFQWVLFERAHASGVGEVEVWDGRERDASWGAVLRGVHRAVVDRCVPVLAVDLVHRVRQIRLLAIHLKQRLLDLRVLDESSERDTNTEDERVGLGFPELVEVVEQSHGVLAGFEVHIRDPRRRFHRFDVEREFRAPEPFVAHARRGFVQQSNRDGACLLRFAQFGWEDMLVSAVAPLGRRDVRIVPFEPVVPDFSEHTTPCFAERLFGSAAELSCRVDAVAVEAVSDAIRDPREVGDVERVESFGDVLAFDDDEPVRFHHVRCGLREHPIGRDPDRASEVFSRDLTDRAFHPHRELACAVDVAIGTCEFEAHLVDRVHALDGIDRVHGFEDLVMRLDVLVGTREDEGDAGAFLVRFADAAAGLDPEVLRFVTRCDAAG